MLPGEIAHLLAQRGRFDILARRKMIRHEGDLVLVEDGAADSLNTLMAGGPVMSLARTRSTWDTSKSPSSTKGRPTWRARIFCVIVIPIVIHSPSLSLREKKNAPPALADRGENSRYHPGFSLHYALLNALPRCPVLCSRPRLPVQMVCRPSKLAPTASSLCRGKEDQFPFFAFVHLWTLVVQRV